jgi:chromosome segregation ATPase
MARTINRDALEQKISKLETAISKNRQQYDQLTKELKELLDKKKALQSEELMKSIADSPRSYEDILRYIKGDSPKDEE